MEIGPELFGQLNGNSLYRLLGLRVEEADGGRAVSVMKPPDEVCWPFPGQPHGGILFTQVDSTMAWAALTAAEPGSNCSTVSLDIQYPNAARNGPYTCVAEVTHQTGRTSFIRSETRDSNGGVLALAQGVFRVFRTKGR